MATKAAKRNDVFYVIGTGTGDMIRYCREVGFARATILHF